MSFPKCRMSNCYNNSSTNTGLSMDFHTKGVTHTHHHQDENTTVEPSLEVGTALWGATWRDLSMQLYRKVTRYAVIKMYSCEKCSHSKSGVC